MPQPLRFLDGPADGSPGVAGVWQDGPGDGNDREPSPGRVEGDYGLEVMPWRNDEVKEAVIYSAKLRVPAVTRPSVILVACRRLQNARAGRREAVRWHDAGWNTRQIARRFGVSQTTIVRDLVDSEMMIKNRSPPRY
jgi:hypothetical protein